MLAADLFAVVSTEFSCVNSELCKSISEFCCVNSELYKSSSGFRCVNSELYKSSSEFYCVSSELYKSSSEFCCYKLSDKKPNSKVSLVRCSRFCRIVLSVVCDCLTSFVVSLFRFEIKSTEYKR